MGLLAWWKWEIYNDAMARKELFHFNSTKPRLHRVLDVGDSLWLVTGRPRAFASGQDHILLMRLVVEDKTFNAPGYTFGKHRLVGDRRRSVYYSPDGPDLTSLLERLPLADGKSLAGTKSMSMSIRSLRELTLDATAMLERRANDLVAIDPLKTG